MQKVIVDWHGVIIGEITVVTGTIGAIVVVVVVDSDISQNDPVHPVWQAQIIWFEFIIKHWPLFLQVFIPTVGEQLIIDVPPCVVVGAWVVSDNDVSQKLP